MPMIPNCEFEGFGEGGGGSIERVDDATIGAEGGSVEVDEDNDDFPNRCCCII
jgi:hypothetical protein